MEKRTVKMSQKDKIKEFLQNNPSLSSSQAKEQLGVGNLRARIDELRKSGVKVFTEQLPNGQYVYRMNQPEPQTQSAAPVIPDLKEQFAQAIKQVLEDKGMLLGSSKQHAPIRQRLEGKNATIADTINGDSELSAEVAKVDGQLRDISNRLSQQVQIVDGLTSVIKKSTENIKRMGEIDRVQDVKRNMVLIDAAKSLRKEMEGVGAAAQITQDTGRKGKQNRQDSLRNPTLNVKSAKIVIEGSAKLDLLAPKEVKRMSGIDKEDKKPTTSDREYSGGSSTGILRGLGALALGAGALSLLMNDEVRDKLTENLGGIIRGATEKLVEHVIVPLSKKAVSAVGEAAMENPALSAFGIGGLSKTASSMASKVGRGASMLGASGIAQKAGVASGAAKTAARTLPLVGGAIDFGARMMEGQSVGKAGAGAMASTIGGVVGATLLSPIPVVGPMIGGVGGAWIGGKIGDGLYNGFFGDDASSGSETLTGAENIDGDVPPSRMKPEDAKMYTFNYLLNNGFSKEQAAGIIGNIMTETNDFKNFVNPNDKTKSGKSVGRAAGIVQWNQGRLKEFQRVVGKDPSDASLKEQLDFMMYELKNGEKAAMAAVSKTTNARDAALAFEAKFERSAKDPVHMRARVSNAEKVLRQMNTMSALPPKNTATMTVPQTPTFLPRSSTPLKDVAPLADMVNTPSIMMPQITNVNAPSTTVAGGSSGGTHVVSVRDSTNPFTRNADKHTGFNFAR